MVYYALKVAISAVLIVVVSEVSKRSSFIGGVLASLPLVSFLAFIWLYLDTKDVGKVADLSTNIFWLVLPSLAFFPLFSYLLRSRWNFYTSMAISAGIMIGLYFLTAFVAKKAGLRL